MSRFWFLFGLMIIVDLKMLKWIEWVNNFVNKVYKLNCNWVIILVKLIYVLVESEDERELLWYMN